MTHVSLFTGIGGLDLAAGRAGFRTVLQVERDPYCLKVLGKHWPTVPRITDVKEVHADDRWRNPTVVSGGFPCQPFSAAGKRRGTSDDRHLWPQMLRIIHELHPLYVVGENVSGLLSIDGGLVFETVCADLECSGYEVLPFHYPAASVGAPHRRDRVFTVAHRNPNRDGEPALTVDAEVAELSGNVADTEEPRLGGWGERGHAGAEQPGSWQGGRAVGADGIAQSGLGRANDGLSPWLDGDWEQGIPRVATGVKHRVQRLKALGNAIVPQQCYPIFAAMAQMEGM